MLRHFIMLLALAISFSNCAKKGSPTGGAKDTIAPIITSSNPQNFAINFNQNQIKIGFDEYIKLKNIKENLIISPPLTYDPLLSPQTSSRTLGIRIMDTLAPETTYVFNFGKSIVDNNEENPYDYFKYVFSTGSYIDSLNLSGSVFPADRPKLEEAATLLLYEASGVKKDSMVFNERPRYVATTFGESAEFTFSNLKPGTYYLVALQEDLNNYSFEPQTDLIGFVEEPITLPNDSSFVLRLFHETQDFKWTRAAHAGKHRIVFGFQGSDEDLEITPLFETGPDFDFAWTKPAEVDSLTYWFKPSFDLEQSDTLYFKAQSPWATDTLWVKLRDLYSDSLRVSLKNKSVVRPRDTIALSANTPIRGINADKITLIDRDSVVLPFTTLIDTVNNTALVLTEKKDDELYRLTLNPGALIDFFEQTNDSLNFGFRTKPLSDYGTLLLSLEEPINYPIVVELVDQNLNVVAQQWLDHKEDVFFDYINPSKYRVRIIEDGNHNKKWDTGSYLQQKQPEYIFYMPGILDIRANWSLNEVFSGSQIVR